jgi:hypothetical protein
MHIDIHIAEKTMARTKRAQVLMEPEEYERLEEVAGRLGVPVAELFRSAVRERYLLTRRERRRLVDGILGLDLPVEDWEETEAAILEARGDDLP